MGACAAPRPVPAAPRPPPCPAPPRRQKVAVVCHQWEAAVRALQVALSVDLNELVEDEMDIAGLLGAAAQRPHLRRLRLVIKAKVHYSTAALLVHHFSALKALHLQPALKDGGVHLPAVRQSGWPGASRSECSSGAHLPAGASTLRPRLPPCALAPCAFATVSVSVRSGPMCSPPAGHCPQPGAPFLPALHHG